MKLLKFINIFDIPNFHNFYQQLTYRNEGNFFISICTKFSFPQQSISNQFFIEKIRLFKSSSLHIFYKILTVNLNHFSMGIF